MCCKNFTETVRKCRTFFGHHYASSRAAVENLMNTFKTVGSHQNVEAGGSPVRVDHLKSAAVTESVHEPLPFVIFVNN